jgi:two-component system, NtrC family, response regulator HydG
LLKYDYPGKYEASEPDRTRRVHADDGGVIDIGHLFSGTELLPPFSVQLTTEGRLARTLMREHEKSEKADNIVASADSGASFAEVELATYRSALAQTSGNVSPAAQILRISRPKLIFQSIDFDGKVWLSTQRKKCRRHTWADGTV